MQRVWRQGVWCRVAGNSAPCASDYLAAQCRAAFWHVMCSSLSVVASNLSLRCEDRASPGYVLAAHPVLCGAVAAKEQRRFFAGYALERRTSNLFTHSAQARSSQRSLVASGRCRPFFSP
jgi:hypothetical protein